MVLNHTELPESFLFDLRVSKLSKSFQSSLRAFRTFSERLEMLEIIYKDAVREVSGVQWYGNSFLTNPASSVGSSVILVFAWSHKVM